MRNHVWAAVFALALGTAAAAAQTTAPSQTLPKPMEEMNGMGHMGMGMHHGMDMDPCKPVDMGHMAGMDMKSMDKSQNEATATSPHKDMDMGKMDGMEMGALKVPPPPTGPLKIAFGAKSAEWTPAALAALPHTTLTLYNMHSKSCQTYSGVPLMELLTKLGVPGKQHGKDLQLYLVAEGSDGYKAVYSLAEVNPDLHDGAVIVADTLDGKPLPEGEQFQLVAKGEKRPARWVRALVAVKVLTAD